MLRPARRRSGRAVPHPAGGHALVLREGLLVTKLDQLAVVEPARATLHQAQAAHNRRVARPEPTLARLAEARRHLAHRREQPTASAQCAAAAAHQRPHGREHQSCWTRPAHDSQPISEGALLSYLCTIGYIQ